MTSKTLVAGIAVAPGREPSSSPLPIFRTGETAVTSARNQSDQSKTFIQRHRLRVRFVLMLLMFGVVASTESRLSGTAAGSALYALGALAIFAAAIGRFWCYVYNSGARSKTVIAEGPYSICRNPIYLCSLAAIFGFGLISQSIVLAVLFAGLALPFYIHVINGEESKMTGLHGSDYLDYKGRTPKYLPRLHLLAPGQIQNVPGEILMRKIPKLIGLGLLFPAAELCDRAGELVGSSLPSIF